VIIINKVIASGYLNTKNPIEIKFTGSGKAVVSFSVATANYKKKDEKQTYTYIDCVAWGNQAEFVANNQDRISKVLVEGKIQKRSYEAQDGSKRYVTETVIENIEVTEWKNEGSNSQNNEYGGAIPVNDNSDIPF
jgi:single-strand DNA-binding protein